MTPTYAILLALSVFLAVVGIDIALAVNRTPGDTYSEVIREASKKWWPVGLAISLLLGLLAGHWFW